jgi:hypothetical protein
MGLSFKNIFAATSLIAFGILGASSAQAVPVAWSFDVCNGCTGSSFSYTSSGNTITATGFTNHTLSTTTNLFAKNQGTGEQGIGLTNDPTHDDEISGKSLIRINLGGVGLFTNLQFSMGSTTGSEEWAVWGSDSATASGTGSNSLNFIEHGKNETLNNLTGNYQYYFFGLDPSDTARNDNVLLATLQGSPTNLTAAVPEPSTWAMLILGFFGMGFVAYRQKGKPALRLV